MRLVMCDDHYHRPGHQVVYRRGCGRRRGGRRGRVLRACLCPGAGARGDGLGHDLVGAAVAAWPAIALVGSYELFMTIIRGARQPDGRVSGADYASGAVSGTDPLRVQAAGVFAADVAAGRVPSIRAIRSRLRVGQSRAQQVRAYLAALGDGWVQSTGVSSVPRQFGTGGARQSGK